MVKENSVEDITMSEIKSISISEYNGMQGIPNIYFKRILKNPFAISPTEEGLKFGIFSGNDVTITSYIF